MKRKEISEKINSDMAKMYAAGKSLAKIGAAYEMSKQAVNERLVKAGVTLRPRNKPLTKKELTEMYKKKKMSIADIAVETERSPSTVKKYLDQHGIAIRSREEQAALVHKSKFDMTKKDLRRMYVTEDMTQKDIAEHYGCAQTLVSRRLQEFGIEKPAKEAAATAG